MDRNLYRSLAQRASDHVDAGEHENALDVLQVLVDSDLPDFDKAMMWLNIATVLDRMGRRDEALATYPHAIECESRTDSYFATQQHAVYLSQLGRYEDSIAVYESLLARPGVTPEDAGIFRMNLRTLAKLAGR